MLWSGLFCLCTSWHHSFEYHLQHFLCAKAPALSAGASFRVCLFLLICFYFLEEAGEHFITLFHERYCKFREQSTLIHKALMTAAKISDIHAFLFFNSHGENLLTLLGAARSLPKDIMEPVGGQKSSFSRVLTQIQRKRYFPA